MHIYTCDYRRCTLRRIGRVHLSTATSRLWTVPVNSHTQLRTTRPTETIRCISAATTVRGRWFSILKNMVTIRLSDVYCFFVRRRGYPDVSLFAHNYKVMQNGKFVETDGTSASTPVMAAFVSLVNAERLKRGMSTMGWINPFLYQYASEFAFDITSGYNKCTALFITTSGVVTSTCCKEGFNATKGWDPVTGLGSVNYEKFRNDYYYIHHHLLLFQVYRNKILILLQISHCMY